MMNVGRVKANVPLVLIQHPMTLSSRFFASLYIEHLKPKINVNPAGNLQNIVLGQQLLYLTDLN